MKSLCITGVCQSDLEQVAQIMNGAGMKDAKPAKRDEAIDLRDWHEQVVAAAEESDDAAQTLLHPGRLWEQLASDIFLANLKTKCWGWAQTQSTFLLDFWAAFEPRLQFVLVCKRPEQWLAHELLSQQDAPVEVADILSTWTAHHEALLRFYHRNVDRCILVDAQDVLGNAHAFVDQLITRWNLPLHRAQVGVPSEASGGALPQYIAQQALGEHRSTRALQDEIVATLTRIGEHYPSESSHHWADLLAEYRDLADQKEQLIRQSEVQTEIKDLKVRLKDTEEENDLLLSQLHQVQEELENYFLKYKEEQSKGQDLEVQLSAAQARWRRMLKRYPDYFYFERAEVMPSPDGTALSWSIHGLEAGGRVLDRVAFKSVIVNGVAGIVLPADGKHLLRQPGMVDDSQEVTLLPAGERTFVERQLETLLSLSSSDWSWFESLPRLLINVLENRPSRLVLSNAFETQPHVNALGKLSGVLTALERLPNMCRFDEVELTREVVNQDYESLWLRLKNLSLDHNWWPEFEFQLSCAKVPRDSFGLHPKLEFPDKSKHAFENWFEESCDDLGVRLELRFALPQSADVSVWSRLSAKDQTLVAALIVRLPVMLAALNKGNKARLNRPIDDWIAVAGSIKQLYEQLLARSTAQTATSPESAAT